MKFEIDVSGYDLFKDNYVICIASDNGDIVKGFKFSKELIENLIANWKSNKYRYEYDINENKRGIFKVRIYSIVLYYLFKSIDKLDWVSLTICRDFKGRNNEITQNLKYLLETNLNIKMGKPLYRRLSKTSSAHIYANMMRRDTKNFLKTYVEISLIDIEKFLQKRK
jgi:hypothetical protein